MTSTCTYIYYEMYLVCSCWREFGSEMKNRTLNIKKNGAEPEGITVGERERTQSEEKDLKKMQATDIH